MLNSVKDIIDDIVISDTGSTDDTIEVVTTLAKQLDKKISIDQTPFKNFGYNRSVAIQAAQRLSKSDFLLMLDADMVFVVTPKFNKKSLLKADVFNVMQKGCTVEYYNCRITRRILPGIKYVGSTHEYFSYPDGARRDNISPDEMYINDIGDGKCKDNKFARDYILLKQDIEEDPKNSRAYYYLAETCRNSGKYKEGVEYYTKKIELGGWVEEVYMSYHGLVLCYLALNDVNNADKTALASFLYYPKRSEALYVMCKHHRVVSNHEKSYMYYQIGSKIPFPKDDLLFVETAVYRYLFEYEYSIIAYYLPHLNKEERNRKVFKFLCQMNPRPGGGELNNAYDNMTFYIQILPSHFQRRDIPASSIPGFNASSTSVLRLDDQSVCYFTRQVNYKIKPDGSYEYPGYVDTRSSLCIEDNNQNIITPPTEVALDTFGTLWNHGECYIRGLEDLRIFHKTQKHNKYTTVYALATMRQFAQDESMNCIALCSVNIHDANIHSIRPLKKLQSCEKNWVPINGTSKCVYSWSPLKIVDLEKTTLDNLVISEEMKESELPEIYKKFRGSSNGILYDGHYWFVVHTVYYGNPRKYVHYLVKMTKNFKLVGATVPFHFDEPRIEYCLGLLVEKSIFKISYSINDACSKEIYIPEEWVRNNFVAL